MASYNSDFNKMQEEALSRLREMQKRSRTAVNKPTMPETQPSPPPPSPVQAAMPPRTHSVQSRRPTPDIFGSILGDIKIDSEKALILLMLFVLYKNKADMKLLLALGYLLI